MTCPDIVFDVVMQVDGSAIDSSVFTYTGATQMLSTHNTDLSLNGDVHDMQIQAQYDGAIYSTFTLDFSVELIDRCVAPSITVPPQTDPAVYTYTLNLPAA